MKILNFGFLDDHLNAIFTRELKKIYSQINDNTKPISKGGEYVSIPSKIMLAPAFTHCKKGFKNYFKRLFGSLFNIDQMILSTISKSKPLPLIEKVFELKSLQIYDTRNGPNMCHSERYTLFCAYNPELDLIYFKNPNNL